MLNQEEEWLLKEKYGGEKSAPVFNESLDEIKNKYSWGGGFFADCKRLAFGVPLGYVIGHTPFLDCHIYLDSKPLIPRPETEFWLEKAINEIKVAATASPRPLQVLDLCAGSGAIGVAVLKAIPTAEITFAEIDACHLPTIQKNIISNSPEYSNRLEYSKVIESDLFDNVTGKFDFVLTNPPYIDPALDRAEASVKDNEPHLALYGGTDGMEIIAKIIEFAPSYLNKNGQLWIEHEPEQALPIHRRAEAFGCSASIYFDQYGVLRYSVLKLA